MFWHRKQPGHEHPPDSERRCSFCNKAQHDVRKLIEGPSVFICDECVQVCNDIVNDDRLHANRLEFAIQPEPTQIVVESGGTKQSYPVPCSFCGLPVVFDEALGVAERGFLCAGCVAAIEAAIAERSRG
jgi:ClpX C4-type zinc finger